MANKKEHYFHIRIRTLYLLLRKRHLISSRCTTNNIKGLTEVTPRAQMICAPIMGSYTYHRRGLMELGGMRYFHVILKIDFMGAQRSSALGKENGQLLVQMYENPRFTAPITNVTTAVGREAILTCLVEDLGNFKVAWLRVDTQTILTIHNHVITKNHRIGVTHSEHKTWFLHIREVKATDKGWYMCQINTDPMKSQVGYLDVVVPPDILDYATSTDVVVREGSSVNLHCVAQGFPAPSITWKRETGEPIKLSNEKEVASAEGSVLNLTRVNRQQMGPYLCIASNGVPPSVSKRIMLIVQFPPMVWIKNQLVGAYQGQQVILECHAEAYPKSINYWTNEKEEMISQGNGKYEPSQKTSSYKIHMRLKIDPVEETDYGKYRCIAKNSLGETDGTIQLFAISKPSKLSNGIPTDILDQTGSPLQETNSGNSREQLGSICTYFLLCLSAVVLAQ